MALVVCATSTTAVAALVTTVTASLVVAAAASRVAVGIVVMSPVVPAVAVAVDDVAVDS